MLVLEFQPLKTKSYDSHASSDRGTSVIAEKNYKYFNC